MFWLGAVIFCLGIYLNDAGYGTGQNNYFMTAAPHDQSDAQAPAYMPAYLRQLEQNSDSGTKNSYGGAKKIFSKNTRGTTKIVYTGTKNGYGGAGSYSNVREWESADTGSMPQGYFNYHQMAKSYAPKCEPDCKNSGICVSENTCNCPSNYHGTYCEFEKVPCLNYPPLPMNAHRKCSAETCTIHCLEGHRFIDGTTVANMRCEEGKWVPARADLTVIPDCQPECDPPCLNGGVCLSLNTCQCPAKYRGPQCQYSASACDVRKLSFNGGYKCLGDDATQKCKLSCPDGSDFSTSPADVYTCRYDSGVFLPQPLPHCVFTEVVVITPANQRNTTFYSYNSGRKGGYNETIRYESHSESYGSYGSGMSGYGGGSSSYGSGSSSYGSGSSGYGSGSSGYGSGSSSYGSGSSSQGSGLSSYGSGSSGYGGGSSHHGGGSSSYGSGSGEYGSTHLGSSNVQVIMQDLTPKGGTCLTWAGAHYKTFDGTVYTFQSPCQHILVREPKEHKYSVVIRQNECKRPGYCPSELTVYLEEKPYTLSVEADGSVLFRNTKRLIPIPASLPGIRVSMPGDYVAVNLDAVGVAIKWDTNNLVQIEGSILLWNNTEGLCGVLDGNPANDLMTKDGAVVQSKFVVASSWKLNKIGDICETSPTETAACATETADDVAKATKFCNEIISMKKFRKCSKVMDVLQFLDACKWDYCACSKTLNSDECACKAISVYAKECLRHDVEEMKSWRDPDTCPMKCPEGKIYKSCGADTQPSCAFPLTSTKSESVCVEGCFCPEGLLLEAGRCVQKKECPCRLRSKSFPPGHVIKKDCNTCSCEGGSWVCTKIPCGARCRAVGDPHYTTFDGLRYDFMGQCTYTMLQAENVTVLVENVACSGSITEQMNLTPYKGQGKPSCTKAVTVTYDGAKIQLKQLGAVTVNDKEISTLPVMVGDIRIRYASSLFIIVQLPIKVDLWWDGNTRVFIDVPPAFHDKTKGLCGTFNLNQKDDFLTPENDVEQSTGAFANKWRTREFCQEMSVEEPPHPCTANVENKQQAENYCAKLKGKVFEACHWHVDVEPYYESCLYDMCACQGDASRCLCPILGDYAMTCAKAGVMIQWRYNVKECELSCSGGQEYTVCADSCLRKCSDSAILACEPSCVEGCACPQGQLLDDSGVCVPIALCPCFHKGLEFKAGYKEVRAGRRERELCTCVGAKWDCTPATPDQIQNYPPAEDLRTNCSATSNMEFTTCARTEHLTCKNMHLPPSPLAAECRPGCQCSSGYVLDTASNLCVVPARCPCHHAGTSYADGHHMAEECNQCVCKSGNWSCTDIKCAGVCAAWGDSHMVTFDGTDYDFEGVCTYLLAKGVMDDRDGFDVEIQNVPCGTTGATCSKSITLKVGTGNDEEIVSLTKNAPLPDISKLKRIKLRLAGAYVFLDVPSLGMSLQWDKEMRVHVKVDSMWQGRVKGLCGNYNGDMRDDFQTPSGGGLAESSPLIFADSWKLKPTCPKPQRIIDHCKQRPERKEWAATTCGALKRYPFTLCHGEVPAGPYVDRCERDACACDSGGDCQCACAALAEYAHVCARRGVAVKWRTQELCPMQCDEECSNYDPCVSACPVETCDNVLYYSEIQTNCEHDTCVEGCKPKKACPVGEVYKNGSTSVCVPIAKCKPICMTLENGTEIAEGEVLEQDDCHTCRCSKHQRICTGQPCASDSCTILPSHFPSLTSKPPLIVTSESHMISESPATTGFTSRGIKMMNREFPMMSSEPPLMSSEPPMMTSEPPMMTSEPPMMTSEPPMVTSGPPMMTSEPPMMTSKTPMITSEPPMMTSEPPMMTSEPPMMTSEPPMKTSEPPMMTSEPPMMTSEPPMMTSEPPMMTSKPPMMTSEPPMMTSEPAMYSSISRITSASQIMTSGSPLITRESPMMMHEMKIMSSTTILDDAYSMTTSDSTMMVGEPKSIFGSAKKINSASLINTIGSISKRSTFITSLTRMLTSGISTMTSETPITTSGTRIITNGTPKETSEIPVMISESPIMISDSPMMTSRSLMNTSDSQMISSDTMMSSKTPMTTESIIKTSETPTIMNELHLMTGTSPIITADSLETGTGSPILKNSFLVISIESPEITTESPLMTTGSSMNTNESPMMTIGSRTRGIKKVTSTFPVITIVSPMMTSATPIKNIVTPDIPHVLPLVTSGSPIMTSRSSMMASGSSMMTSGSPTMTSGYSMITSGYSLMASGSPIMTSGSPAMTSGAAIKTTEDSTIIPEDPTITNVLPIIKSGIPSPIKNFTPMMTIRLPKWMSVHHGFIKGGGYYPFSRTVLRSPPEAPETTPHPNDQGLQCATGWSPWLSRGSPEVASNGGHLEVEPLPKVNELHIGSPMCKVEQMTSIECRTVGDHKSPKETGVDVECSLERGLVCREKTAVCPDFEIRVYCQCEARNPCENSTIPAPHPTDCSKFIQCNGVEPVETKCGAGSLFNPRTLVCDWPAAVAIVRPECGNTTETTTPTTTITPTTHTTPPTPAPRCPPGQMYSDCTYPCDKLCDHFKKTVMNRGLCAGEKCIEGCIDIAVAHIECDYGSFWRDEKTCVPKKDCTCLSEVDNKIVKPGGVVIDGCLHCQCLGNAFHCDASECASPIPFAGPTHQSLVVPRVFDTPRTTLFIPDTTPTTTQKPTTILEETTRMTLPYFEEGREEIIVTRTTVSPPPECHPDEYYDLMWGDDPLPDSAFSASSVASAMFEPQYAKLNGHPLDTTAGSWNPSTHDGNQYIQVELPSKEPIYGVILQGSPLFSQYVISYEVLYGDDGVVFHRVEESGKPKIFQGPSASNVASKQMIVPPIEAKFIRIHPLSWHNEISVRMELIGCRVPTTTETEELVGTTEIATLEPLQCTEPLGIAADLPLDSISVSSNLAEKQFLTLDAEHAWRPLYSTPGEWVMFNFTSPRNITGIKTKGGEKGWVTFYKVLFTSNLEHFNPVLDKDAKERLFPANTDGDSEAMLEFHPPIHAQYVKVIPVKWHKVIEMRVEPIGCFEPYPTPPPTTLAPAPLTTPAACALCPGVQPPETCACAPFQYYDGENCVLRSQCPCVISFMSYPVGSTFRGANCDQCVCKLGGVTSCSPVKECKCEGPINGNLVPKLLPTTCECLCEPCPTGTKVCPHGKMCLAHDKWCDGLQDCPDDELNCTTLPPPTEPTVVTAQAVAAAAAVIASTVVKPVQCPVVACPPGYTVQYRSSRPRNPYSYALDLPPPRPRYSYQRYYKGGGGGYTKTGFSKGGYSGGYSKGGFSKGGFSKGGFSKGGFGSYSPPPKPSQPFTLDKPAIATAAPPTEVHTCPQFTCVPPLPPFHAPGATPAAVVCSVVTCPSGYTLKMDTMKGVNKCPQYECVPPPERASFCNITGRTFNTFDGAEFKYDVCFHILARENRFNAWTIVVRKKCRSEGCWNELLIAQDDQMILVKPTMMIEYENYEYNVEQTSKICFQKNSFDIARLGDGVSVKSRKYNFTVLFSKEGDIKIGVLKKHMGIVDGLCGAFDGDKANDRRLPDGNLATSIQQFGSAWGKPGMAADACQARVVAAAKQKRVWELCDVISHEPLSHCGSVLSLDKWRSICLEKICECSELVVNGTKRSEQECRCLLLQQMVAECLAADDRVDLAAWRIKTECPAECPAPLVHYDCFHRRCEPSCETGGLKSESSCEVEPGACYPGCYCPEGTLRLGDDCVLPQDCLDCTCNGVGSPAKYVTFEGDELPYLCNCTYLASRDRNDTGLHSYQVFATNAPCEDNPSVMCTKSVHLAFGKNVIHVSKNPDNQKLLISVGETAVYNFPLKESWGSIVLENKQDVTITLSDSHVQLKVLASKMEFNINVPSSIYANRTQGLCGVCEGYQEALITSNGTTTDNFEEYGKSWQASPSDLSALSIPPQEQCDQPPPVEECVPPPAELNPCYNLYNKDRFGACHALLDPDSFVHSCEADLCANTSDSCTSLERYAAACRAQGVCLEHWRADLCPYPCDAPLTYRSCVDCERTCENFDELAANPKKCDKLPVEGCFCPEGKVRVNNTCIVPSKCFPCDANKEHFAGDEWQTSACTKCTCSKLRGSNSAHVACTTESCTTPLCSDREDVITEPAKPGQCCATHVCVPKPKVATCVEPKKMDCGYGQVLKQKTTPDGCQEFACECKPASECETIPPDSDVEMFEPGMQRLVDRSGCCPKAELVCRKDRCPGSPACPQFHDLKIKNDTEKCCPEYTCELPKDKCLVKLEWEAAAKGGEKSRTTPQVMFKELDSVWLDGPCRTCRCAVGPRGAAPVCDVTECPAILSTEQLVLEPRPVPFACCPQPEQVACRSRDNIYKVGENWTSPLDACTQYKCKRHDDGTLERVTTVQACETKCQPGWEYSSPPSEQCCGACVPVACVVGKETHRIGTVWTSEDHCANYTCLLQNGTLQIQSANETCPEISKALQKQFVLKSHKVAGKCCPKVEAVACRVGNQIYQEGQTWQTKDPCKNMTCAREGGVLTTQVHVENCMNTCKKGWVYAPPAAGICCGRCVEDSCVVKEELKKPGTTWQSSDNCTTFSCERAGEEVFVTSSRQTCASVSACPAEYLKQEGCCQVCREPPEALSKCVPTSIPLNDTIGLVRKHLGPHGACENKQTVAGFKECRGTCESGALYDTLAGVHNSACECCSAVKFSPLEVTLECADGSRQPHQLASPVLCACRACGPQRGNFWGTKSGEIKSPSSRIAIKSPMRSPTETEEESEIIPRIYRRFGADTYKRK